MSIAKAPRSESSRAGKFINAAGAGKGKAPSAADIAVTVRVPPPVLKQIDDLVAARRVRTARHTWLLEAILAKLDSEQNPQQ